MHTYIYMTDIIQIQISLKVNLKILIKSEQTLPENNNDLEILQQENCTSTFPLFDTHSVDQICILFKPYFLNVVSTMLPHLIISF